MYIEVALKTIMQEKKMCFNIKVVLDGTFEFADFLKSCIYK